MRFRVLTVGDDTTCTARDPPKAVHEHDSAGREGLIDKITDAGQVNEEVLHFRVVQVDSEVVGAVRGPVLQYGYDVRDFVLSEERGFDGRCQT